MICPLKCLIWSATVACTYRPSVGLYWWHPQTDSGFVYRCALELLEGASIRSSVFFDSWNSGFRQASARSRIICPWSSYSTAPLLRCRWDLKIFISFHSFLPFDCYREVFIDQGSKNEAVVSGLPLFQGLLYWGFFNIKKALKNLKS